MNWLVTCPENSASVPAYLGWLRQGGMHGTVVAGNFAHPGNLNGFDSLLLAGGPDISPSLYGETFVHLKTYGVDLARDRLELRLFEEFSRQGKLVFGICRGIQLLNVARGGGLLQHVPDAIGDAPVEDHRQPEGYGARHPLVAAGDAALGRVLSAVTEVNSAHHQAIDPSRLGQGLRIAARSGGGVVEAVESTCAGERILAVQWHPERLDAGHPASASLLDYLTRLA